MIEEPLPARELPDVTPDAAGEIAEAPSAEQLRKERLKVAYLVNQYPHASHTFIRREIQALEAQGVEVVRITVRRSSEALVDEADVAEKKRTLVLLSDRLALLSSLLRQAAARPREFWTSLRTAVSLGRRSDRGMIRNLVYLVQACRLFELCQTHDVQQLHAHFGTNPAAVALLCRQLGGPEFSITIHGPEDFDRPSQLALTEKIAGASFVAAISEFTRSQLYRWASVGDWNKIEVIRCGLDGAFLNQPASPVPDVPRFVCVGRLCEQKGQINLIRAAALLKKRGITVEVVVIGDGPMRAVLEESIARYGLKDSVKLLGWQDSERIRREITASRALVLPSFAEGLPVVLMEALALGRPVVTTYIAGIPELVEPGVNGWLVPAGSETALASALEEAVTTDVARLAQLGRAGAAKVRHQHAATREASKLLARWKQLHVSTDE